MMVMMKMMPTTTRPTRTTRRGRGRRANVARADARDAARGGIVFDADAVKQWAGKVTAAAWDAPARGWREFFAAKPIGAVVEVDNAAETISAKEVESHGLNWPTCGAEAVARARVNTVRFRQNYALAAGAATLLGSECAAFAMALVSFYAHLALRSDAILGEVSLMTGGGGVTWNDAVVGGVRRSTLKSWTLGVAVALFLLSDATANTYAVMRSVAWTAAVALLHAILRPIDLKGTLADIVKDFRSAKSKEDLRGAARAGLTSMRAWISEKAKPTQSTPIFVVEKGEKKRPSDHGATPTRRSEDADGAIDVDARDAEKKKYLP